MSEQRYQAVMAVIADGLAPAAACEEPMPRPGTGPSSLSHAAGFSKAFCEYIFCMGTLWNRFGSKHYSSGHFAAFFG